MLGACSLAESRGLAREGLRERLRGLLRRLGLPTEVSEPVSLGSLRRFLWRDKKVSQGTLRFVLTPRIGRVSIGHVVSEEELASALEALRPHRRRKVPQAYRRRG
jgi:3-dehydroquinate synthase